MTNVKYSTWGKITQDIHTYIMQDDTKLNNLVITVCEKDLGVYIDSDLSFDDYIKTTINKAKNICHL